MLFTETLFIYLNTENGAQLLICAVLFQLNVEVILKVRFFFHCVHAQESNF